MLCHLGELNDSAQARWLKTIEVFNEAGEQHQLKLFPGRKRKTILWSTWSLLSHDHDVDSSFLLGCPHGPSWHPRCTDSKKSEYVTMILLVGVWTTRRLV
jgi:hypothetical protein